MLKWDEKVKIENKMLNSSSEQYNKEYLKHHNTNENSKKR